MVVVLLQVDPLVALSTKPGLAVINDQDIDFTVAIEKFLGVIEVKSLRFQDEDTYNVEKSKVHRVMWNSLGFRKTYLNF